METLDSEALSKPSVVGRRVSDEEIHGPGTALPIVPDRGQGHVRGAAGAEARAHDGNEVCW